MLNFTKNATAKTPFYVSNGSAGIDFFSDSTENIKLNPGEERLISTGISVQFPELTCGLLISKSGIAKRGVIVKTPGLIDTDYTGIIFVVLKNVGNDIVILDKDESITQMLLIKYEKVELRECLSFPTNDNLIINTRKDKGFGEMTKEYFQINKKIVGKRRLI